MLEYSYENLAYIVNNYEGIEQEQVDDIEHYLKYAWPIIPHDRKISVQNEYKKAGNLGGVLSEEISETL